MTSKGVIELNTQHPYIGQMGVHLHILVSGHEAQSQLTGPGLRSAVAPQSYSINTPSH